MDIIEMTIVSATSLDARSVLGNVNDSGQMVTARQSDKSESALQDRLPRQKGRIRQE